jgi:hypothetical protein
MVDSSLHAPKFARGLTGARLRKIIKKKGGKQMPGRVNAIAAWASIIGAVLLLAIFLVSYRVILIQKHLQAVQSELADVKGRGVQSGGKWPI